MANYNTHAQVTITVNGRQANQMMADLEKRSKSLTKAMEAANKAGDKEKLKTLSRELRQVNDAMAKLRGSTATAEEVLKRLDSATPKELNKALRELKRQMDNIERGSDLWKQKAEQIKRVKAELAALNSELSNSRSRWDRFTDAVNKSGAAIMAGVAAATGVIAAGKKSVDDFAEMDQQMANVRKYTGQTERQVAAMNEQFKEIDTRSAREELNQLAQQAGRLGKQAQEDVTGFVKAAGKINVSLDDLGSDATLTISKLTGIFGDEERLGTEKAMLSVGSVINELSQNCAASAPYLAEFASRVGGVGSQANMTIPQIMAFGAVLDSANQNVEASATALSQVIVRIYQEPAKYAKVAGLDIAKFAETVRTDMNGALIELLEALNAAGSMDVLSPMFADMGENGARAISSLSTLAARIGEVKEQQDAANVAFKEAISIDKEFNVQNTTMQARLEKSKNRLHEMSVELGEKLAPIMSHIYSSSSALLRVMSTITSFLIEHSKALVGLTTTIVVYSVAVKAAAADITIYNVVTKTATAITKAWNVALQAFNRTLIASPIGMAAAAIGILTTAILKAKDATSEFTKTMREAANVSSNMRKELGNEQRQIDELFGKLQGLKEGTDDFKLAKDAIISQYGKYLKGLIDEKNEIIDLEEAYRRLGAAARASDRDRAISSARETAQNAFDDKIADLADEFQQKLVDEGKDLRSAVAMAQRLVVELKSSGGVSAELKSQLDRLPRGIGVTKTAWAVSRQMIGASRTYRETQSAIDDVEATTNPVGTLSQSQLEELYEKMLMAGNRKDKSMQFVTGGTKAFQARTFNINNKNYDDILAEVEARLSLSESSNATSNRKPEGDFRSTATTDSKSSKDRFTAEKEWREREEALARISYATGESSYVEYTERMKEIAADYYDKILEHTDLSEAERLKAEADGYEAREALGKQVFANSVEEESAYYNERLATIKQHYIDGLYSKNTYDEAVQRAEMEHQRALVALYDDGSKEQVAASAKLQDMLLKQQQERQRKVEQHEKQIVSMETKVFGHSEGNREQYEESLTILNEAYARAQEMARQNGEETTEITRLFLIEQLKLKKSTIGLSAEEDAKLQKLMADNTKNSAAETCKNVSGIINEIASQMSSVFSMLTNLVNAEMEIQTAAIEKRYDKEISLAEGNAYRVAQLEKQKEKEIAKAKNDASKKTYAMQVIQAIAQTASNALSAYGAMAGIPVVGPALAAVAAAAAVAAGMLQVATLKKQQQAAAAQGYSSGGFTPKGRVDEPVGVVHAGEWVASQRLLANPQARTIIESLDYVQRRNTIGSITSADISGAVVSPPSARAFSSMPVPKIELHTSGGGAGGGADMGASLRRLNERLDEPFVTVNTVEGDNGINQAIDKHNRLVKRSKPRRNR